MTTIHKYSFIQFYTPSRYDDYIDLGNGFSDTLDLCKTMGNVHWVQHDGLLWASTYKMLQNTMELDKFEEVPLPEKAKNIYVSSIYITHLYQAYVWAKQHPDINFVVGGPAVISNLFVLRDELPSNLTLTVKSVEDYVGINDFQYSWKLEDIPFKNKKVVFSYTIDTNCYWNKCIYCNFTFCKRRKRENLLFEFNKCQYNGDKIIRINTSSTTREQLTSIIPMLPKLTHVRYDFYIRFGTNERKALEELRDKTKDLSLRFLTGIEFPSDRMLSFMNKGINTHQIFYMLELLSTLPHIEPLMFIILGWEELEKEDLKDLKKFLERIPTHAKIAITRIFARPYTKLHEMYSVEKEQQLGPFYLGFVPKISQEKMKLNLEARDLLLECPNVVDFSRGIL